LATFSAAKYENIIGSKVPSDCENNLEKLAEFFLGNDQMAFFIEKLVPWELFRRDHNKGHRAVADFLASSVTYVTVTTNFDVLVETAADELGEPDFQVSLDGEEASRVHEHRPFLKLHGCCVRDRHQTLWSKSQVSQERISTRLLSMENWLRGNLVGRDLVFVGFWSDWAYLNDILGSCIRTAIPATVVLVDPLSEASLQTKSPQLWEWAHRNGVVFCHVQQSGDEFLDELRRLFCRRFLDRVVYDSYSSCSTIVGTIESMPSFEGSLSTEELYSIRRDACGQPNGAVCRKKTPDAAMRMVGATHLLLFKKGAMLNGSVYQLAGRRIRVVQGAGQPLSAIRRKFSHEVPNVMAPDVVICAGAYDDGGVPADLVRESTLPTIVRSNAEGRWISFESARGELGI
jgi:hypothetical protein